MEGIGIPSGTPWVPPPEPSPLPVGAVRVASGVGSFEVPVFSVAAELAIGAVRSI